MDVKAFNLGLDNDLVYFSIDHGHPHPFPCPKRKPISSSSYSFSYWGVDLHTVCIGVPYQTGEQAKLRGNENEGAEHDNNRVNDSNIVPSDRGFSLRLQALSSVVIGEDTALNMTMNATAAWALEPICSIIALKASKQSRMK
ncbi:uncharacterized protein A4U43_C08F30560 [Asparagus officinalis]|nr:uncharacterized protein A4U43_C08F30560 [Asparagus officinalis]